MAGSSRRTKGGLIFARRPPSLQNLIASQEARIAALEGKLAKVSADADNVYILGANLHIRSGIGATDGAVNGLGNLIVGYNEPSVFGDVRSGSHNLVVGMMHSFLSYGGLVAGAENVISGPFASVNGGSLSTASGLYASVGGGRSNKASGMYASVSGGGGGRSAAEGNIADYSSILGGRSNKAGDPALVDHTVGAQATVSGGAYNIASGQNSSVSGGSTNTAGALSAWAAGGWQNTASGEDSSVSGGLSNTASGLGASVSGGDTNSASNWAAAVSGGYQHSAPVQYNWAAGTYSSPQRAGFVERRQ